MRRTFLLGLLLLTGACALIEPAGQRFVVFFQPGGFALEDEAVPVVKAAAAYAASHAGKPVVVAGFADPNGTAEGSDSVSMLRAQNVVKALVENGVPAASITRRSFGSVPYTFDSQEGRRVEITVGTP
jgi:outer membrane protein OmpA-like peptidoglycan-associated protein